MATKAKQSSVIGKEKKTPSTNSHITISTKRTTKSSTTITTSSPTKPTSTPSTKTIPNYLKPTISSIINASPNKPIPNQRRTLNKPLSSSNSTKQNQPSSKPHNTIARTKPLQSPSTQVKSTKLSKPISDRTSKTPITNGKTKPSLVTKKVVNNGHASSISRNSKAKIIESEEVKEVEVVIKVENEEHKVENLATSHVVESLHDHDGVEEYEEKVISIVPEEEEEEEEAKKESEEEDSTNQDENNKNESHQEEYEVEVKDEDRKSENNNEEEKVKDKEASEEVEEVKDESKESNLKEQVAIRGNGKKEAKISNDVIEETASKLLEERKNKVKALAGAFQSVIDYQAPTK